jgi:hypothetical protein
MTKPVAAISVAVAGFFFFEAGAADDAKWKSLTPNSSCPKI